MVRGEDGVGPVRVVLTVVVAAAVLGVIGGVVWGLLAPAEHFVVVEPGRGAALTGESLHRFDSLALFVCIALVSAVVLPVAFWTWRCKRGPVLYLGLLIGSAVGSAITLGIGVWIAGLIDPRPEDPSVGTVVAVAPGVESPLALVVGPLVVSLVVVLLAAMSPHDNLVDTPEEASVDVESDLSTLESDHA